MCIHFSIYQAALDRRIVRIETQRRNLGTCRGLKSKVTPFGSQRNTVEVKLTAIVKKVPEGYIGFVQELPGANTQGRTLEEARTNLQEAITLVLEANRQLAEEGS